MGVGYAFIGGFLQGTVDKKREQQAALQKEQELKAEAQKNAGSQFFEAVEAGFDINSPFMQTLGTQAGFDMANIGNMVQKVDDTTMFGSGRNGVRFNFNYSDENVSERATRTLGDLQMTFSNPESRAEYFQKFMNNPAAAQQFINTVDMHMTQYSQDFYFNNSGRDEQTRTIKSPVFTDYSIYGDVVGFTDELKASLGVEGPSQQFRVVQAAINNQTEGKGLAENQVFVKTEQSGQQFTGTVYTLSDGEQGKAEKLFLDALAEKKGYVDANHMMYNMDDFMYGDDAQQNVNLLLNQTRQLSEAGALDMLKGVGADQDTENTVAEILFGKNGVAPKGDPAKLMSAVLPLIPDPQEFRVPGVQTPPVNGKAFMEARGVDVDDLKNKNEFGKKAVELQTLIISNIEDGKVKLGFAGAMQRIAIGLAGPGGQFDQLFSNVPVDQLEEDTNYRTLQATASEVFAKYGIDVAQTLGETQTAAIQLAYAQARAVDSNGRLSDADFKIQLDQILSTNLFQNTNVQIGSLRTLQKQFTRVVEDSQFYVDMSTRDITKKEAKMFEANKIIERARERSRALKAADTTTGAVPVAQTFTQMQEQGINLKDAPYTRDGYKYYRDDSQQIVERDLKTDTVRLVTDTSEIRQYFSRKPSGESNADKPGEVAGTAAQQPAEVPEAQQAPAGTSPTAASLIPASKFAGNQPRFQDGFYVIDGKNYNRVEREGPSGKLEPFYEEAK